MHSIKIIIALLLLSSAGFSQNLTGTWEGSGGGSEYCKLVIIHVNDSLFGYTYDTGLGYCKCNFAGKYDSIKNKLNGKNTSVIEKTPMHGMSEYHLSYSKKGDKEFLKGRVTPKSAGAKIMSFGLSAPVHYTKIKTEIDTTKLIADKVAYYKAIAAGNKQESKTEEPKAVVHPVVEPVQVQPPPSIDSTLKLAKNSRKTEVIQTITTSYDTLTITLYDNGEIDGDTVTVFLNNQVLINQLGLGSKPYEMKVAIPADGTTQMIDFVANNLGSIPPNTAYMQIRTIEKEYTLRVSSDFSTNARIEVKYEAPGKKR